MRGLLLTVLLVAGCNSGPSGSDIPAAGSVYRVTMVLSLPGSQPSTMTGDLHVVTASEESISGHVVGIENMDTAPFTLGFRNVDEYRLDAGMFANVVAQIRISFGADTCSATARYPGLRVEPMTCAIAER